MPTITNDSQLLKAMEDAARNALDGITNEVLGLFQEQYVRKYVYDSHGENAMYHAGTKTATNEFLEAWQFDNIKKTLNTLSTELWYNPGKLHFDMDTFLHGSLYSTPPDIRASMPQILEGKQSSLWISVNRPVKFFEQFISDMFSGGQLEKIITKHFLNNGFTKI